MLDVVDQGRGNSRILFILTVIRKAFIFSVKGLGSGNGLCKQDFDIKNMVPRLILQYNFNG